MYLIYRREGSDGLKRGKRLLYNKEANNNTDNNDYKNEDYFDIRNTIIVTFYKP